MDRRSVYFLWCFVISYCAATVYSNWRQLWKKNCATSWQCCCCYCWLCVVRRWDQKSYLPFPGLDLVLSSGGVKNTLRWRRWWPPRQAGVDAMKGQAFWHPGKVGFGGGGNTQLSLCSAFFPDVSRFLLCLFCVVFFRGSILYSHGQLQHLQRRPLSRKFAWFGSDWDLKLTSPSQGH